MRSVFYFSLLTAVLFAVCKANPVIAEPAHPYAGSPTGCRVPNSTYCGVDYSVPDVIATLVHVIEEEIRGQLENNNLPGEELDACQMAKKEIQCAQKFPKCVNNTVILTSTPDCENRITTNCPSESTMLLTQLDFCGLEEITVNQGQCASLDSFASGSQTELSHCGVVGGGTLVTEWMFELIRFTDLQLVKTLEGLEAVSSSTCISNHAAYFCSFLGQCSEDGAEMQLKNGYQSCEDTLNCYDNSLAENLRTLFPCELWGSLVYPPPPVVQTTTTTTQNQPSSTVQPTVFSVNPEPRTFSPGNGAQTLHTTINYVICLTVVLLSLLASLL